MTLRKRLRILWAALTQKWHPHICRECQAAWWCQAPHCERSDFAEEVCLSCVDKLAHRWLAERELDRRLRWSARRPLSRKEMH